MPGQSKVFVFGLITDGVVIGDWDGSGQIPARVVGNQPGDISRFGSLDPTEGGHTDRENLSMLWNYTPGDDETWKFARGQALLIAESGNLLMLRPPKTGTGQETWMRLSTDLREKASALATLTGARDYERSRLALADVAQSCNRCHETFRVPTRVGPENRPGVRDTE